MSGLPETAPTGLAVSVRDVVVSYAGRRVLDGINLDISRGETMVLLGGSGSGKSTLLRQLIGLERPQSGQILVNGLDLSKCTARDLRKMRRSIGVAFQDGALFNSMSVEDNIALPLREHTQLV
jgi:phospholipid/cholesterol/gamma-HCH transport system ATP-binding protein